MPSRLVCSACGAVNCDIAPQRAPDRFTCGRCGQQALQRQNVHPNIVGGAAVGAIIGLVVGGFVGLLLGAVVGALLASYPEVR